MRLVNRAGTGAARMLLVLSGMAILWSYYQQA